MCIKTDICIARDNTLQIFATGKSPIEHISKYNARDERESSMLGTKQKVFEFNHQFPIYDDKNISLCPHCFSGLVMTWSEEDS